ncbi:MULTISPECIES: DUF397 domain-containing protein [unclassified Streptomyces]|uniref:DUF397 domain-containing protein n=1 Tax=unclassified Streptomyces TaxID=2593676 RepID=UPI002366D683|nr:MULTISPECIES: DUF397 domain-containing protein [unclassified Streptomyces]MDF3140695.1 DUF397 domain-containing protein [Streptomyces sp. T21Q-yed]WDF40039.1 DUF397 domain-containing protein [Streptomyces sp. T12]
MFEFDFQKSTHSSGDAHGECVEVACNVPGTVAVRDSKVVDGPILRLTAVTWVEFAAFVGRR